MPIYTAFVYRWTNLITNRKYIGAHKGTEDDGYISSSRPFNEDYNTNPSNFKREILARGTKEEIFALEAKILKEVDAARNDEYYNMTNGDGKFYNKGGHSISDKGRTNISEAKKGKNNPMYGMTCDKNPFWGKKHSEETKEKLRNAWTEQRRSKQREMYSGVNNPLYGKKHTAEWKEATSLRRKGIPGVPHTQKTKDILRLKRKDKRSYCLTDSNGTDHITNDIVAFCVEKGLDPQAMRRISRGQQFTHRGWSSRYV